MAKTEKEILLDNLKNGEFLTFEWENPTNNTTSDCTVFKYGNQLYYYYGNGKVTKDSLATIATSSSACRKFGDTDREYISSHDAEYTIKENPTSKTVETVQDEAKNAIKANNPSLSEDQASTLAKSADISRDANDNLVVSVPEENNSSTQYVFNDKNQVTTETVTQDGKETKKTNYSYAGDKISEKSVEETNEKGEKVNKTTQYTYSNTGREETTETQVNGTKTGTSVIKFDNNGNPTQETEMDSSGKPIHGITYEYDSAGNKTKSVETTAIESGGTHQVSIIYEGDHEKERQTVESDGQTRITTTITHNEDGSIHTVVTRQNKTSTGVWTDPIGVEDYTTPATSDTSLDSTTASTTEINEEEFQKYLEYYKKQPGNENEDEAKIRADYIAAKSCTKESKYGNTLDQYKVEKKFLDPKLTGIQKILGSGNSKQVTAFVEFLKTKLQNGKLFNFDTTQFTGEASQTYQQLMAELKEKANTLTSNAEIAEQATKLITEELIPALQSLAELDIQREKLRKELEPLIKEYNDVLTDMSNTPETVPDKYKPTDPTVQVDSEGYATRDVENPEYVKLKKRKLELEEKIDEIRESRSITINGETVSGLVGLDELGQRLQDKCYDILGKETNLEGLIKEFKRMYFGNGGGRDPGGDNPGGGGGEPPTEPLPELPDNTQDQMNYYQDLSIGDLSDISDNLTKFAETNNLTVQELLSDEKNAEKLVEYLGTLGVLSEDLKKLINEGDPVKTQALLKNIFTGKEATVVGLDSLTKNVVINKLNTLAASNNTTIADLLSKEENAALIRKELSGYSDIASKLKSISAENMKSQLSNIYDGDGVDDYSGSTLKTLKDYIDAASKNNNQSVEEYLQSDASVKNMQNLGKTSVLLNTLSGFDDKTLMESLQSFITTSTQ
ncbi:MAG: hypothetical protein IKQ33_04990 [Clostridia bacterium]|nr:hypothetical protein [Clostridia bacterium]